jgi:hypothetical protein
MHTFIRAASLAAMWLFVFACSEGTSTSTTGTGGSTGSGGAGTGGDAARSIVDAFCTTVTAPFCEAYLACCTHPDFNIAGGLNLDYTTALKNCEEVIPQDTFINHFCLGDRRREELAALLREGATVFDQAQFDSCLDLLKSMTAGGAACVEPPRNVLLKTCTTAFRGQIALGDACPYPEDTFRYLFLQPSMVCKGGRCEYGKCVSFLKPGDACELILDQDLRYYNPAPTLCNLLNREVCRGDPGAGGAGGGGGAGGATVMGTCRPQGELGDACNPANPHECKSLNCDVTGKCVLPDPDWSACDQY